MDIKTIKSFWVVLLVSVLVVSVFSVAVGGSHLGETEMAGHGEMGILVHNTGRSEYLKNYPGYEVIEEYGSYLLVETTEENVENLEESGYRLERLENRDYVGLQSYSFRTRGEEPDIPESLEIESYEEDETGHYVVQFIGPIKPEWKESVEEKGAELHEFRHRFNFIVEMDPETKEDVKDLDFVNWIGIYQPAYRFDKELLERSDPLYLDVSLFDGANSGLIASDIGELGTKVHYVGEDRINVEVEAEDIVNLANLEEVKSISERSSERRLFNSRATWVTQTNEENNRKVTEMGVTGEGELITVMDSGLFAEHEMFADPDNEIGDDHRKIQARYIPEGARGDVDEEMGYMHGSHVAGSVLGQSPPYGEYSNQDGNAMEARVAFQDVSEDGMSIGPPPDMYNNAYGDVYDMAEGSRVHTNSWGSPSEDVAGTYTEFTQETDEFIWDHKDFNILFAAGNEGDEALTVSPEASGKNVIGVGATEGGAGGLRGNARVLDEPGPQDNIAGFSSRGYALDGRIKPDILHVGDGVSSADFEDPEGYMGMGGTSMSCPGIAGQVGQVRDYFNSGWYPTGTPNQADGFNPSNALVRATLINGAVEIDGEGAYLNDQRFPNNDQGFGRSKLDRVMHFEGDDRNLQIYDSLKEDDSIDTGENWNMSFSVEDPSQELEITLAWTDHPGSVGSDSSDPAIVNDLDLQLKDPEGTTYTGNAYMDHNPGYSEPDPTDNPWNGLRDGEFDGLNVIENILLLPDQNGVEEGNYELTVTGHNVPEGPQPFAVVVTGGVGDEVMIGDPPSLDILSPSGGEEWVSGTEQTIEWDATPHEDDPLDEIELEYSLEDDGYWTPIEPGPAGAEIGHYEWEIPEVDEVKNECRIRMRVTDIEGRESERVSSDNFSIYPPPDIQIVSPEEGTLFSESPIDIQWDSTNVYDGHMIELDGDMVAELGPEETSYTIDDIDDGEHEVKVTAVTGADVTETDSVRFTLDTTAPEIEIESPEEGHISSENSMRVSWTGQARGSEIDHYEVRTDETGWTGIGTRTSYTFEGLSDGTRTAEVRAIDEAGHQAEDSVSFTVDTTPPNIVIDSPVDGAMFNQDTVTISWSSSDETTSIQYHEIKLNGQVIEENLNSGQEEYDVVGLDDGVHIVEVTAVDEADHEDSDRVEFTIDTEDPEIEIVSPDDEDIFGTDQVMVEWSATARGTDIETYEVRRDGGVWHTADSQASHTFSDLGEGIHEVEVRVIDEVENENTDTVSFTVDTTEPSLDINSPSEGYLSSTDSIRIEWQGDDETTGIERYEVRREDYSWTSVGDETSYMFEELDDGDHTFEVKAVDRAGNEEVQSVYIIIDTTPPELNIVSPEVGSEIDEDSVTVEWNEEPKGTNVVSYEIRINEGEWQTPENVNGHTFEGLEDGDYTVEIRITDEAGHESIETIEFTVDTFSLMNYWWLIPLIALIIIILFAFAWKRQKEEEESEVPETGQMWERKEDSLPVLETEEEEQESEWAGPTSSEQIDEEDDRVTEKETTKKVKKKKKVPKKKTDEEKEGSLESEEELEETDEEKEEPPKLDEDVEEPDEESEEPPKFEEDLEKTDEEKDESPKFDEGLEETDEEKDVPPEPKEGKLVGTSEKNEEEEFKDDFDEGFDDEEGTTKCPLCGNEVSPSAKRCFACGKDLTEGGQEKGDEETEDDTEEEAEEDNLEDG